MLFEPGPIALIPDSEFPTAGPRSNLAGDAAQLAAALAAHEGALGARQLTMAGGLTTTMEGDAALELAAAAAAHDGQSRAFDASIGAVSSNADVQAGELAGLTNDVADDIRAGEVSPPGFVEHPGLGGPGGEENPREPPDVTRPEDTLGAAIIGFYQMYFRRTPDNAEINEHANNPGGASAIEQAILGSEEYANHVSELYQQYFERPASGDEIDEHRRHHDSLAAVEDNVRSRA